MPRIEGQDGTPAKVSADGRLETEASVFAEEHEAAIEGNAYTLDIDGVTVGADGNWLAVIKNGDDRDMVVTSFTLQPNEAKDDEEIEVWLGGTFVYLAEGDPIVPANVRSGISGGAEGEFYLTDGTADTMTTIAGGYVTGRYHLRSTLLYKCHKTTGWIIPKNQCFMLQASKDNKFYGYISFYFHGTCGAGNKS